MVAFLAFPGRIPAIYHLNPLPLARVLGEPFGALVGRRDRRGRLYVRGPPLSEADRNPSNASSFMRIAPRGLLVEEYEP